MHLVEAGGQRFLLDCGLSRADREEGGWRNGYFPFDPASLDAVILSHAHIDHCGNLPHLVRQGFQGPIYCTPATRDLVAIMLADSARINEEDALVSAIVGRPVAFRGSPYSRSDAEQAVSQCVTVPYDQSRDISQTAQLSFVDSGHILGSAMVSLTVAHGTKTYRITFTGDLGRRGLPFLSEVDRLPPCDLLICESTYGGRTHETLERMAEKLSDVVRRTLGRGGKVLVPAFSLGRTQLVVHYFQRWMRDGILPRMPIHVDSPLASSIAEVYSRHTNAFRPGGSNGDAVVQYVGSPDESKELSLNPDPCVIVASGGMCEGGRIVQHLRNHVDDPRTSVVLVSYQAPDSLGSRLLELRPTVRFHGRNWNKWVEVAELNGFSGHADYNDFLALLGPLAETTRQVRLVHGEMAQSEALATGLRGIGFVDVGVPRREETVVLS
jgi:metallo-beta-lactamase family protein